MAIQIPTLSGAGVRTRPIGTPQVRAQQADTSLLQLGQQALGVAGKLYQKSVEDADNAALINAESQLSNWKLKTMFDSEAGVYSRKGRNALDITNQTMPQFDQEATRISGELTNDRQRARWQQIITNQRINMSAELNRYEFGERQTFYDETDDASLTAAAAGATAYYNVPEQIAYYQNKGSRVVVANGQRKGLPLEAIEQNVQTFNSRVATSVVERMAVDDPLKAQQYFATASGFMTPTDNLKVSKLLGTAVRKQMGSQIGTAAFETGGLGADALPALVIQAESGGDPAAIGPVTRTGERARGLMQLMPETAKEMAAELDIVYDEERLTADPQYNMALGTAYLNKMMGRYNGNAALALAAYNAGPGAVDKWIKESGDPRTGEISNQDFIERIPFKETRDYAGKIIGQMEAPATGARQLANATSAVQKIEDPELRQYALDRVDDLYKAQQLELKADYEAAARIVMEQGFNAVPAAALDRLPADDQAKLRKMDDMRRKGLEPETDLAKLQEFVTMPPARLAELSLERDIRPHLNDADFKRVVTAYQKAANGDTSGQGALKAEQTALNQVMAMAGIEVGNTKDARAPKNLQRQQLFRASYQARKDAIFAATGQEPTAGEAQSIAEQLLLDVRLSGTGTFSDDARKLWEVAPEELSKAYLDRGDLALGDIPPGERLRIVQVLRANGQAASEANIVAAYIEKISGLGVTVR